MVGWFAAWGAICSDMEGGGSRRTPGVGRFEYGQASEAALLAWGTVLLALRSESRGRDSLIGRGEVVDGPLCSGAQQINGQSQRGALSVGDREG